MNYFVTYARCFYKNPSSFTDMQEHVEAVLDDAERQEFVNYIESLLKQPENEVIIWLSSWKTVNLEVPLFIGVVIGAD